MGERNQKKSDVEKTLGGKIRFKSRVKQDLLIVGKPRTQGEVDIDSLLSQIRDRDQQIAEHKRIKNRKAAKRAKI